MHPVRRPELRQISSETYVLSKPGISVRLYLDSDDLDSMQRQISALKKKD